MGSSLVKNKDDLSFTVYIDRSKDVTFSTHCEILAHGISYNV
jgi:hypothetical protein